MIKCDSCGEMMGYQDATLAWTLPPSGRSLHPALLHDFGVGGCFDRYKDAHRSSGLVMRRSCADRRCAVLIRDEYDWESVPDVVEVLMRVFR